MIAKVNGKLLSLLLKMILNLSNLTEEMEKRLSDQLRYLTISAIDEEWGIVVTTVGYQFIPPKGNYPLSKHPDNYNFKPQTGRILNEYQLVYITKGSGYFSAQSCKMQKINAGTMILLFPGEWHSYYPDSETGWDEYWVGFRGVHIDRRVEKRFFTREEPLQHIGLSATIVGLYEDSFTNTYVVDKINEARILMKEQVENPLTPEEIASRLGLGYSWFRRMFKEYTGVSPAQYQLQQKLLKAKELLTSSSMNISEIAYSLKFENAGQFSTFFKKKEGVTPSEFRERAH